MAIRTWWRAAACGIGLSISAGAAAAPLEVYGHLPTLEEVALSPDGSRVAFVRTEGDARFLIVMSLADRKQIGAVKVADSKLRTVEWIDNDRLALTVSMTGVVRSLMSDRHEFWQLLIYDLPKQRLRNPLDQGSGMTRQRESMTANFIWSLPMVRQVNGASRLYVEGMSAQSGYLPVMIEIDPLSATVRKVRSADRTLSGWLVDDQGEVVVEEHYHDRVQDQRWSFRIRADGQLREMLAGHAGLDVPTMVGFAPDGASVWVRTVRDDAYTWQSLSLQDGRLSPPLDAASDYARVLLDRATDRVMGAVKWGPDAEVVFTDPVRQARWHDIARAFPGERVDFVCASDDFSQVVVTLQGQRDRLMYMLVDLKTGHAVSLGQRYAGLDALAEQRSISYRAADGLALQAFLTLPPGRPEKGLPLIVLPHGGPAATEVAGFDWWAQALAAQGYAVLQPNFRGSTSSRELQAAGFGEWGRKMQTDLSDGVRYLAASGLVDPQRVCIAGGSYGGYAALAGVTLDPGVYRCAVSLAGVSDLRLLYADEVGGVNYEEDLGRRYWNRYLGTSGPSDPKLDDLSPVRHVAAVSAPVLLIHGRDDTVVLFKQSQVMASALRSAGKPVEFVELKGEDHWLSRTETRMQMLQATVSFLKVNNPPD
jgi:dipeptidyl aminopeptidase/acylaminoacyl peptidase